MLDIPGITLRALRRAMGETQASVAEKLGIKQENVSRLEQRTDMLLSTINEYLEALGGRLSLVAEFDGRAPVRVAGFADAGIAPSAPGNATTPPALKGAP